MVKVFVESTTGFAFDHISGGGELPPTEGLNLRDSCHLKRKEEAEGKKNRIILCL
jgi:hypothetical protein